MEVPATPAPLTPLGARTPLAHPALYAVIAVLALIVIGIIWLRISSSTSWTSYSEEAFGFSMRYPADWLLTATSEDDLGGPGITITNPDESSDSISVSFDAAYPFEEQSHQVIRERYPDTALRYIPLRELFSVRPTGPYEEIRFNGIDAYRFIDTEAAGRSGRQSTYFRVQDAPGYIPRLVQISAASSPSETADEILSAMRFMTASTDGLTRGIDLRTVISLLCYFDRPAEGVPPIPASGGTGVMISRDGYFLTNRHNIDIDWLEAADFVDDTGRTQGWRFDHCIAGIPSESNPPSVEDIRNDISRPASVQYSFTTEVIAVPQDAGVSTRESIAFDVALMRIIGLNPDVTPSSEDRQMLTEGFPFAPLASAVNDQDGIYLSYGYPMFSEVPQQVPGQGRVPLGAIARLSPPVTDGTDPFNTPKVLRFSAERNFQHGRSGSPVFHDGSVVGLFFRGDTGFTGKSDALEYCVASPAIIQWLQNAGFGDVIGAIR